jgi:hypothetical protein
MRIILGITFVLSLAIAAPAGAADVFASPGAKATLTVDYIYSSSGSKSSSLYDPYQGRVARNVKLIAELVAQPATAMPTVQPMDATQMAGLKDKAEKVQAVSNDMAPMMADAQAIMEKCGDDEECVTREVMKMGAGMQEKDVSKAKKGVEELSKQDAPRYQAWRATSQKGTYSIDETVHISNKDPICQSRPRQRCTRDEVRKGAGEVPPPPGRKKSNDAAAGIGAVELDSAKNTVTLALPVPLALLPYTETITTDEPEGTHDTPTPKGPQKKLHGFRVSNTGPTHEKPLTVPLKGGWRSQSGEEVINLEGENGEAGKLTIRWSFVAQ